MFFINHRESLMPRVIYNTCAYIVRGRGRALVSTQPISVPIENVRSRVRQSCRSVLHSTGAGNGPQTTASRRHFFLLKWKRSGLVKLRASGRKLREDKIEKAGSARMKDPAGDGPEPTHIPQSPPSTQVSATHVAAAQTPREVGPACPSPETCQVRARANRFRASVSLVSS